MPTETIPDKKENDYLNLKNQFLKGKINQKEFQDILLNFDQSTLERDHSIPNLKLLKDPEISNWFIEHKEYLPEYYHFLSFTEFHVGQVIAFESNSKEARQHFQNSLDASKQGESGSPDWENYIQATLAYLDNDLEKLKFFSNQNMIGKNKIVVQGFIEGLEKRGLPEYSQDY